MKNTIENAILAALTDYMENEGKYTPHNPAIVRDQEGFCYTSALIPHDGMIWDLRDGLGYFEPEEGDDLPALAAGLAKLVADGMASADE